MCGSLLGPVQQLCVAFNALLNKFRVLGKNKCASLSVANA